MTDVFFTSSAFNGAFARRMDFSPSPTAIRRASSCPCAALTEQAKSMLILSAQTAALACQAMQTTLDTCQTISWKGQAATQFQRICNEYAASSNGTEHYLRATIQAIQHW